MPGGLCDEWMAGVQEPKRLGKPLTWEGSKSFTLLRKQASEGPLWYGTGTAPRQEHADRRAQTREVETSDMTKVCLYFNTHKEVGDISKGPTDEFPHSHLCPVPCSHISSRKYG